MVSKNDKEFICCRVPKEINNIISVLSEQEEIKKVVFVRRSLRNFLAGDRIINDRLKISERSDPRHIFKGYKFSTYIDKQQKEELIKISEEQGCSLSQIFLQALIDYCELLFKQYNIDICIYDKF